jgi:electron-transferring-flavoprotein dehydrogenase
MSFPTIRSAARPIYALARCRPTASSSSRASTSTLPLVKTRSYASEAPFDPSTVERATDEVDVCIVGGGPAGLSAAIRFKQLEQERGGEELRVVVLEKGGEVGECSGRSFCVSALTEFNLTHRQPHSLWSSHRD